MEKQQLQKKMYGTNFTLFYLTPPGLEPTSYSTRGEASTTCNHYSIDVILNQIKVRIWKVY